MTGNYQSAMYCSFERNDARKSNELTDLMSTEYVQSIDIKSIAKSCICYGSFGCSLENINDICFELNGDMDCM